jgi:hypothetical protein
LDTFHIDDKQQTIVNSNHDAIKRYTISSMYSAILTVYIFDALHIDDKKQTIVNSNHDSINSRSNSSSHSTILTHYIFDTCIHDKQQTIVNIVTMIPSTAIPTHHRIPLYLHPIYWIHHISMTKQQTIVNIVTMIPSTAIPTHHCIPLYLHPIYWIHHISMTKQQTVVNSNQDSINSHSNSSLYSTLLTPYLLDSSHIHGQQTI